MIIPFDQNLINGYKKFNMVRTDRQDLFALGLKSSYITVYPRYINLNGDVFYSTSFGHSETKLERDLEKIFYFLDFKYNDRYDEKSRGEKNFINYMIYKSNLIFDSIKALRIYKLFPGLIEDLADKYNVNRPLYIPTEKEIRSGYDETMFYKGERSFKDFIFTGIALTPQEFLDYHISELKKDYKQIPNIEELTGNKILEYINYNANVYMEHIFKFNKKGVYSEQMLDLLNKELSTKEDVCNVVYSALRNTPDPIKVINDFYLKHYNTKYKSHREENILLDLLVSFIGLDKIETEAKDTITTSKTNIYESFFNYLIMDYNIVQLPKIIFDEEEQKLKVIKPVDYREDIINSNYKEEIELIKKYIPYNERMKYFK